MKLNPRNSAECSTMIDGLQAKLDTLIEAPVESSRSDLVEFHFDLYMNEISVASEHYYNGTQKTYTVKFDEDGVMDDDVEWENIYDGGYMDYRRLPKEVRAVCEEIARLALEIESLENLMLDLQEEEEQAVELQEVNAESVKVVDADTVKIVGKCTVKAIGNIKDIGTACFVVYLHKDKESDSASVFIKDCNDLRKVSKANHSALEAAVIDQVKFLRVILSR